MMDTTTIKDKLARFGRTLALLLNRSLMYQKSHPMVKNSIIEVQNLAEILFHSISPVVFILNRQQFYVDEEQLDPRINVKRIAHLFKIHGIQSVSFEDGLTIGELDILIDLFSSMTTSTNADTIRNNLLKRGAYNIRINHVIYKKVTEDDQVVSRDTLKQVTPAMEDDDSESRQKFMDTLLETILTDEFANTLNIKSLLDNPGLVSKNMIEADLVNAERLGGGYPKGTGGIGPGGPANVVLSDAAPSSTGDGGTAENISNATTGAGSDLSGAAPSGAGSGTAAIISNTASGADSAFEGAGGPHTDTNALSGEKTPFSTEKKNDHIAGPLKTVTNAVATGTSKTTTHGKILMHQLNLMHQQVWKHLEEGGDISLDALADAVFDMKKQLFEDIQTQKALGIAYANEDAIVDNINDLTDQVILKLIQEEYDDGKITTQRFAQIILRLIPESKELKRLLPQIKQRLLECGMSIDAYLDLVDELKHELQNEELSRIIEESSEAIGVDSEKIIEELKEDSGQATKLIYLANEIREGGGDESALVDILVEYVEQLTRKAAEESDGKGGDDHLKTVISNVESTVLGQLSKMDVGQDVLLRMEKRVNERMDSILDGMRVEWLQKQTHTARKEKTKPLTVLQTLEHNVGDDEVMGEILKSVRAKVDEGEIEENNFSQIHSEIILREKKLKELADGKDIPEGVLSPNEVIFILEKEISRANRYNFPFSALAFSFVNIKPKMKSLEALVSTEAVMSAALDKLLNIIREGDYIGQIGTNKMVALLPMQTISEAKLALTRIMNLLHSKPLLVKEIPVQLRVAGVASQYDSEQTQEAHLFAKKLSNHLMDMVSRVKNIQVLF